MSGDSVNANDGVETAEVVYWAQGQPARMKSGEKSPRRKNAIRAAGNYGQEK
jgi:hypothetical protein